MLRLSSLALLGALLLGLLGPAPASALSLTIHGFTAGQSLWIRHQGSTRQTAAVEFQAELDGTAGVSYCIDLHDDPFFGTADYVALDLATLPGGLAAAWLLRTHGPGSQAANPVLAITALQIALWEVTADLGYDLGAGNFQLVAATQAATALAEQYLAAIPLALTLADAAGVAGLGHAVHQDQLFLGPSFIPTPEPASALLLGAGLAALAGARRHRLRQLRLR